MGSGSTRPNSVEAKMMSVLERGVQDDTFKDSKPPKNKDTKLIKDKEEHALKLREKKAKLKALRLAAEQEGKVPS